MQTQPVEVPVSSAKPHRRRWPWILGGSLAVLAGALACWALVGPARPLSPAEQPLVGKWTLPMGPNSPPNAVHQFFWLRPDRSLWVGSRPVGASEVSFKLKGSWRLDEEHLVLHAQGPDSAGQVMARVFGQAPPPPTINDRLRVLGGDGDVLRVEGEGGSVGTFLRLPD